MNFDKEYKSEKKTKCEIECGGWGGSKTKTVIQTVKRGKIQNHIHNEKHVVNKHFKNVNYF